MDDPNDDVECPACVLDGTDPVFARWVGRCICTTKNEPCDGQPFMVMFLQRDGINYVSTLCLEHYNKTMDHLEGRKLAPHRCGKDSDDSTAPT